jgi:hypothetical protein
MMGHSKNRVRKYRAGLLLDWIAKYGFDVIDWRVAVGKGADWVISKEGKDAWDMIRDLQKTKALVDLPNGDYQLDREKAVRYIEKYMT